MASKSKRARRPSTTSRASISFPPEVYGELEKIAEVKKVSLAWVVREAAERYIADQWPLLSSASKPDQGA